MNQAWVSGQAGVAVTRSNPLRVHRIGGDTVDVVSQLEASNVLRSCTDIELVAYKQDGDLLSLLRLHWSQDRALRLLLICLSDPSEIDADCLEALQKLLRDSRNSARIRNEFFARPLPAELPQLPGAAGELMDEIGRAQPAIRRVALALDELPVASFDDNAARDRAVELLISKGAARHAAEGLAANKTVDELHFDLVRMLQQVPHGRTIVRDFVATLRDEKEARRSLEHSDADQDHEDQELPPMVPGGGRAYRNALEQQAGVINKLREGNLAAARSYASQLVDSQRRSSEPAHIAKSLCRLSQEAKKLGYFDIQLEWARAAVEVAPTDAFTHGQEADALISLRRYGEAEIALKHSEQAGDRHYAATGRARILRQTGHFVEALKVLREAKEIPGDSDQKYIPWALTAEILVDLNRVSEGAQEYVQAIRQFPNEVVLYCGLAALLEEQGQLSESDEVYGRALAVSPGNGVARNGRATLRKTAGQLDAALQMYSDVIRDDSNNPIAACGRADVMRLAGNTAGALKEYDLIIEKFPALIVAYAAKADLLSEAGKFGQAFKTIEFARAKFPYEPQFSIVHARAKLASGHFSQAHLLFEKALREHPYSLEAKLGVAAALRKLRRFADAVVVYQRLIDSGVGSPSVRLGLASALICQGRHLSAMELLPSSYRSEQDWSGFLLKLVALSRSTGPSTAIEHYNRFASNIPFARFRSLARAVMARISLEQNNSRDALRIADPQARGIGEIVYFHALAASPDRRKDADALLKKINQSNRPRDEKKLAREIAAQHKIVPLRALQTSAWILSEEQTLLALAAA